MPVAERLAARCRQQLSIFAQHNRACGAGVGERTGHNWFNSVATTRVSEPVRLASWAPIFNHYRPRLERLLADPARGDP